jgi:hypothetical protein
LERGRKLAGTTWRAANTDLIGAGLRQHTKGVLCARVSQTAKGKVKGALVSREKGGGTLF